MYKYLLKKVHYGFVQYGNPHWHDPNSITVKYKDGVNEDVIIEIPGERRDGFLLAYVLNYAILPRGRSEKMWTENRTMSLIGSTSGSFKKNYHYLILHRFLGEKLNLYYKQEALIIIKLAFLDV